jgi:hypothetical protein
VPAIIAVIKTYYGKMGKDNQFLLKCWTIDDVKNLLTNAISTQLTSNTSVELTLNRNTPYSWFVNSKSSKNPTVGLSPTWKFYNSALQYD